MTTKCPECGATIEAPEDLEWGEILDCENCGAELDVVSVDPFQVTVFEEDEK